MYIYDFVLFFASLHRKTPALKECINQLQNLLLELLKKFILQMLD